MNRPATDRRRFPFPPAIPVIALALSWGMGKLWPVDVNEPVWLRWAGGVLIAINPVLAASAVVTFRRHHTAIDPRGTVTTIVSSGPFGLTRNPMYLSLMLFYVGCTLALNLQWAWLLLVPVFLALHFGVIMAEEQYLDAAFGEPYRLYRQRVRRWL